MKFSGGKILLILVICFIFASMFRNTYSSTDDIEYDYKVTEIVDNNGNVPAYGYYTDQISRSIWGLKAYDDKIFMGLGDFDNNTGPTKIIYYDTKDETIKSSGTIADEAIEWFNIIDSNLYTTGTDPTNNNWGYGSYYVYNKNNNDWIQHEFNNGWVHVFDIEKFDGKFFMSGSVDTDNYSNSIIQFSNDGGITFNNVEINYKGTNISSLNSYLRFYNMVIYNNELYAQLYAVYDEFGDYNGYYKYESKNNRFNFISENQTCYCNDCIVTETASKNCYLFNSIEFNDKLVYLLGDYLYTTSNVIDFNKVSKINNVAISNMLVYNNTLYLLTYKYNSNNKNFTTGIYETKDLVNFDKIYEFTASSLPYSFEYYNGSFYIGTIYSEKVNSAGNLYRVDKIDTDVEIVFDDSLDVDVINKYIRFTGNSTKYFENSTSVSDLINMVSGSTISVTVNDYNDKQKSLSSKLVTGDKMVILNDKNNKIDEYAISILGDVNGDGVVDLIDLVQLRKVYAKWKAPGDDKVFTKNGIYAVSGDLNLDGTIDLIDLLKVRKIVANWKD